MASIATGAGGTDLRSVQRDRSRCRGVTRRGLAASPDARDLISRHRLPRLSSFNGFGLERVRCWLHLAFARGTFLTLHRDLEHALLHELDHFLR